MDKVRAGRLVPESQHVRLLVPDMTVLTAISCRAEDLGDEPALRERMHRIMRHTQAISDSIGELAELGLVADATAEVRVHRTVPLVKVGNTEITAVEGKPLPPTSKPGNGWKLVDPTKHKK
jgi:hypothetical protein